MSSLTFAAVFSDGMVLQREKPVPIWGSGSVGELVTVTLAGKSASAIVWEDGTWKTSLPAIPAGGPWTLTVSCGTQTLCRERVYLGEVWLAGGQSNMELALKDSRDGEQAVQNSGNPYLHYYQPLKVTTVQEAERQEAEHSGWQTVTPETAGDLSAVAYYAAKPLQSIFQESISVFWSAAGAEPMPIVGCPEKTWQNSRQDSGVWIGTNPGLAKRLTMNLTRSLPPIKGRLTIGIAV